MVELAELTTNIRKLRTAGKPAEAIPSAQQYVKTMVEHEGDAHPDTAFAITLLASLQLEAKAYDEAKRSAARAAKAYQQSLGDDHPEALVPVGVFGTRAIRNR